MTDPIQPVRLVVLTTLFIIILPIRLLAAEPTGYRLEDKPDRHLAMVGSHGTLWKLNIKKEEGKPYFHPVATVGGTVDGAVLTCPRPSDHPWHRGLWFSWKTINGLNYWEEDLKTGKSEGVTEIIDVEVPRKNKQGMTVVIRLSYHPPGRPPLLDERRTLSITAPQADGSYYIDWVQHFTAGKQQDVLLDRTDPKVKSWGGYAGLSYRAAQTITETVLSGSNGRRDTKINGRRARWVDTSGLFDQGGKRTAAGVTIFDHPSNPRHPSHWHIVKTQAKSGPFVYMNPALLFHEPLKLPAGNSLRLYYRVLIHRGRGDPEKLEKQFEQFAATSPPDA